MGEWKPPLEPVPETWDDEGWERFVREPGDYEAPAVSGPLITRVADVEAEPITWLWEQRIPMAALTLLDGHPDTGKSTVTLDLAARVSKGRRMPDGSRGIDGSALLLATEDTLAKPVRERLEAAEADLERIYGLEIMGERDPFGRPASFPEDTRVLQQAIMHTEAKLVVIDPIMGHLSSTINSGIDAEIRRALNPMVRVAVETGAAVVLVRHLRKPDSKAKHSSVSFIEGGGSLGGFGIVRAGLMAVRDPDDESLTTLYQTKHNYGTLVRPIDYTFEQAGVTRGVGRIRWLPR